MLKNFRAEIEYLLSKVPKEIWSEVTGLWVDYYPWHEQFCIAVRVANENPKDSSSWKHHYGMNSDNARIQAELIEYNESEKYAGKKEFAKLIQATEILDRHFTEIAEALLSINYSKYTNKTPFLNAKNLNPDFLLQAVNDDDPKRKDFCDDNKLIHRYYKKPAAKKATQAADNRSAAKPAATKKSTLKPTKKAGAKKVTAKQTVTNKKPLKTKPAVKPIKKSNSPKQRAKT